MIVALVTVAALIVAFCIVWVPDGRPSFLQTLFGIPILLVGVSFLFLFENGCDAPGSDRNIVVTRALDGTLTAHGTGVAWCPKQCVNVPAWVDTWVTLPSGITFKARFTVKDPVALVRALKLDTVDHVVPPEEVESTAFRVLRPYLNGYLETHMEQLLRRALHQDAALQSTQREIAAYLAHPTIPGDGRPVSPSAVPYSTLGLELLELCCTQVAGTGGS